MRADRLIALLLLLQAKGRVTAAQAAEELEVSVRTARRDLEALAMSGVPVYPQVGRGGGWRLLGGATTDLTGLSADEARALFLAAGPEVTSTPQLQQALRKLSAALPETFRADAEAASSAIKIDPTGWGQIVAGETPPFLALLTDAVVGGHRVEIGYGSPRSTYRKRLVHPLGLVTKRNVWYLVANAETDDGLAIRTFRVGRVRSVELLDGAVERPPDFDLDRVWEDIVTEVDVLRRGTSIQGEIRHDLVGALRLTLGPGNLDIGEPIDPDRPDSPIAVTMRASDIRAFAAQTAGFGRALRLLDPPAAVLDELRRVGRELRELYG